MPMRLFIAIELPKSVRAQLAAMRKELGGYCTGGRFVTEQNYHITLHFIGESDRLLDITAAMREAARGIRAFSLHLGELSSFGSGGGVTGIVGVQGDLRELGILYEALQCALFDMGFSRERRRYTPHVTIGRGMGFTPEYQAAKQELGALCRGASFSVNGITLFESRLGRGEPLYTPVHRERF